jgi:tetratricopeptide (TPR) repeat protein
LVFEKGLMGRVENNLSQMSAFARSAVQSKDWATVNSFASKILKQDKKSPEGHFLTGLVEKAAGKTHKAIKAFSKAINLDARRYDAGIELANQYMILLRNGEALTLLKRYEPRLGNSPLYLDMAANIHTRLGLHASAWPLYKKANELQPDIDMFQANLAACAVYLGKIEQAKAIYSGLLEKYPSHQGNHFQLSGLETAKDASHVQQMQRVLDSNGLPPEKNIFLYYALGKELEDLELWQEAFHYFKLAGDTVDKMAGYDVGHDIGIIDKVIEVCNSDWLTASAKVPQSKKPQKTPIFIVGLPRTGTTLTERIVSSHSAVESADETFFMQMVIRRVSGVEGRESMSAAIIEAAAKKDIGRIARDYMNAVEYRLGDRPFFIDKLPENTLYLGFIARAFPDAHFIHLRRNPMDSCFAMYKQSYFKFAYTLENLSRYYVAYDRLRSHWEEVLGDRVIEVEYESLVADQEGEIRGLLDKLGLEFEQSCLDFDQNEAPSATASAVQVREKVHTRSVHKWKKFATELQPLKDHLESSGICVD